VSEFHAMATQRHAFEQLVSSFCPSIFGQELVKAGILLALLGGTKAEAKSKTRSASATGEGGGGGAKRRKLGSDPHPHPHPHPHTRPQPVSSANAGAGAGADGELSVRSDIHVLVVGDPGLGKVRDRELLCSAACLHCPVALSLQTFLFLPSYHCHTHITKCFVFTESTTARCGCAGPAGRVRMRTLSVCRGADGERGQGERRRRQRRRQRRHRHRGGRAGKQTPEVSPSLMCMCVHVCACVCMCVHVCACVCMCVHVCACVCM
jgi:DNA replicative helicase MCM subunit Mcm2 (Cdc46/Mcm family)